MLDGMVAVESGVASPVGELFNEVPDRVSDAAMLIGAGYSLGGEPALGYVAACLALFVAYVRAQGKAAGAHQEFCGPLAKPQRVFLITVAALLSAIATAAWQDSGVQATTPVVHGSLMHWGLWIMIVGATMTAVRRLHRIAIALKGELK
jgi:phosphatidylglycerophosphate synthase